ncbi:MAG: hypothetical protein E7335_02590 [Clostridiales bacterium]|nr:hypothetical protein [Clostridiales bacterium]
MSEWIGEMGGLAAVMLIAALAVRFFHEIGIWKDAALLRTRAKAALFVVLTGVAYMSLYGAFFKFFRSDVAIWNIRAVWGINSFTMYLCYFLTVAGALFLESIRKHLSWVVFLPFAFYLYTRPAAALIFALISICAYLFIPTKYKNQPFSLPESSEIWLFPAICVLDAFVLFLCV